MLFWDVCSSPVHVHALCKAAGMEELVSAVHIENRTTQAAKQCTAHTTPEHITRNLSVDTVQSLHLRSGLTSLPCAPGDPASARPSRMIASVDVVARWCLCVRA